MLGFDGVGAFVEVVLVDACEGVTDSCVEDGIFKVMLFSRVSESG